MILLKKKFWKEFVANFKESKWLIIKYLVVGIYLVISGIIANRLQLNELTYFNAILTLSYIGEMISFGCSEGFGMFANLNITDPEKYRKYIKIGFVFSVVVNLIFTIILCVFPTFVLKSWLALDFEVDLYFYYLMLISFFISAVAQYIADILKKLGLFGWQMIITAVKSFLTILGFLILVVASVLMLRLISIVYIIAGIVTVVFAYLALLKNKKYPINILKPEPIKLGKSELKTILSRASSEIIFEVGYIFLSLFILKSNTVLYNQYCYFENVLDILNGVFFAYVNVVAIKICRSIGEKDRAEAYHQAIYCRWGVFVIWLGYTIISLSLYYPIRLGLNPELQVGSFIPMLLYLLLSLIRWVAWTMCTYIIGQSERYAEHGLVWESGVAVYYIILYLLARVIPYSMYIVFGLIALESVVKILSYGKIIKERKWLSRLEEHIEEEETMLDYEDEFEVAEIVGNEIKENIKELKKKPIPEEEPIEMEIVEKNVPLDIVMVEKRKVIKSKSLEKVVEVRNIAKIRARYSRFH